MIKNFAIRLYNKLIMMDNNNPWFEKHIRFQSIELLGWFLHPEFRKENKLVTVVKKNKQGNFSGGNKV